MRVVENTTQVTTNLSVTSLDLNWQRVLALRTSSPHMRLDAIRQLHAAKIPLGVSGRTDHPGLTDHEIPKILDASAKTGTQFAGYTIVRLPSAVAAIAAVILARVKR